MNLLDELLKSRQEPALAFTREEYDRRLASVRASMRADGLDLLLCSNTSNVGYLTGYDTTMPAGYVMLIVPAAGQMTLHCSELEAASMLLTGIVDDIEIIDWYDALDTASDLARVLRERCHDARRVGLEMGYSDNFASGAYDARSYLRLIADRHETEFVDATLMVLQTRLRKSPPELDYMRIAGTYTWAGLKAGLGAVRAGATDNHVAAAAHQAMLDMGSELMPSDPMVITGRRTGYLPHIAHRRTLLEPGDPVYLEIGGAHNRYTAPAMRTASVGPPTSQVERLSEVAIETLFLVLGNIKPGRTADDVAQVAKRGLEGVDRLFFHGGFGYSIGMGFQPSWAENPVIIVEGAEWEFKPGMTFHLPICVSVPGEAGVGFSESIVVTERGCETLTPCLEVELRQA